MAHRRLRAVVRVDRWDLCRSWRSRARGLVQQGVSEAARRARVLARIPWAVLAAGSLCATALLLACAIGTSGDCSENGTCPGDGTRLDAGVDAVIGDEPVESALAEDLGADA